MAISIDAFQHLPDDALLWVYTTDRDIGGSDQVEVLSQVRQFISTWTSHQQPVTANAIFTHNRFLIVSAHIPDGNVSGCGIDKLVNRLEELEANHSWMWANSLDVVYVDQANRVCSVSRPQFRTMVREGIVGPDTNVFDTSIHSLSELRVGTFEKPARESWHGKVFQLVTEIGA